MIKTLKYLVDQHDNDYSHLEVEYRRQTGSELVIDPYASVCQSLPNIKLTASVIIPAYNASHTILQCLYAIEQSSFNRKYPRQLEVVVVDDGSTDGTWQLLHQLSLNLSLKIVRQANYGRSQARNVALAVATGDVVICCDADLVMTPFTIEEFMKRHQVFDHVLLLGFYTYLPETHPALLPRNYGTLAAPFQLDRRVKAFTGVWPGSTCCDTHHLKHLGKGRVLYNPYDVQINLPQTVFGPLFSLRRRDFLLMGGFEERIQGWGGEIMLAGARAIALGNYIIPVYSAGGFHIYQRLNDLHFLWRYDPEERQTRQEFGPNLQLYHHFLNAPFAPAPASWVDHVQTRIQDLHECQPALHRMSPPHDETFCFPYHQVLTHPDSYSQYLLNLGRYHEALEILATMQDSEDIQQMQRIVCKQAEALLHIGRPQEAVSRLQEALTTLPPHEDIHVALAFALAANADFVAAQHHVCEAQKINPTNTVVRYLIGRSFTQHRERARLFALQGDYELALRDYEAALICKPNHFPTYVEWTQVLCSIGRLETAKAAHDAYTLFTYSAIVAAPDCIRLLDDAWDALAANRLGIAKLALEHLRRRCDPEVPIITHLQEIHECTEANNWQYSHRALLATVGDIPGPFTGNEVELILAMALQKLVARDTDQLVTMIELGSFCGQATVLLGKAIQSTMAPARVIAVYEVSNEVVDIEYAYTGHSCLALPQEVFYWQLQRHRVAEHVMHTTTNPEDYDSNLLLISQQGRAENVRQKVEIFLNRLRPGGVLLMHQYTENHPAIQDLIHELLLSGAYQFLTQVDSLIALQRKLKGAVLREQRHTHLYLNTK